MIKRGCFILCTFLGWALPFLSQDIPINKVRILASHNSYKLAPDRHQMRFLNRIKRFMPPGLDPSEMDYGHEPIPIQLDSFLIRGLELDVYSDPVGGAFYKRRLPFFAWGIQQRSKIELLKEPGIKVLHIKDVDYHSSVNTWNDALFQLKEWSLLHPEHSVVYVNVEIKSDSPGSSSKWLRRMGFKPAPAFDQLALQELRKSAEQILGSQIFTPVMMKDQWGSIQDRIQKIGWPSIAETKGKFIFILEGLTADLQELVLNANQGEMFFYYGNEQDQRVGFVLKNNCVGRELEIKKCVEKGLMVRTRADAGTRESRMNDLTTFHAALKSNAQIISTDYYRPDKRWSDYQVEIVKKKEWQLLLVE